MCCNEPVATNMIESDTPAIDGGEKYAQILIGTKTLIMNVYCMKTSAQFPGTSPNEVLQPSWSVISHRLR